MESKLTEATTMKTQDVRRPANVDKLEFDLLTQWTSIRLRVLGHTFTQAVVIVTQELTRWLEIRLRDTDLLQASPWHERSKTYIPEYQVICDYTNNPTESIARGQLSATVRVVLYGKLWKWELTLAP